ncbi:MAG TPA: hypothetical protein PKH65_03790 [Bacteroidia bacterium]|nr:hypothetical protein [Bacteroidia bacterium]HNT79781.1 hypothetical protein [Bacteroidia bacterium]
MKKIILTLCLFIPLIGFSQVEIDKMLDEAKAYAKEEKYSLATASLQEAINKLNDEIGKQLLNNMPSAVDQMSYAKENDNVTSIGTMMGAGFTASRVYQGESGKTLNVSIMPNSPQADAIQMFFDNPQDYGVENDAGHTIKIQDRNALVKFSDDEEDEYAYAQMVIQRALVTFSAQGYESEKKFVEAVNQIDLNKLAKALGAKDDKN